MNLSVLVPNWRKHCFFLWEPIQGVMVCFVGYFLGWWGWVQKGPHCAPSLFFPKYRVLQVYSR